MGMSSSRRAAIAPFYAMQVLREANARAARGRDVLHLEIGEPSRRAPDAVITAAHQALSEKPLGYTEALGLPALRERIARHYGESYGVNVEPRRVAVTTGSSGAFLLSYLSAFDAGDEVAITTPTYPAYRNTMTALDLRPVLVPTGPNTGFQPSAELIRALPRKPMGLVVASPSNPTGSMLGREELAGLATYCREDGIRLISDEVYHGVTFERRADSVLSFSDEALIVNSFSKYYAMTGWRLGWLIVPDDLLEAVERLAQNLFISPPAVPQYAALAAFKCREELDAEVQRYRTNRDILLDELPKAGLSRFAPAQGAFYLYAEVSELADDSVRFCERMLEEIGVAATPGIDFDPERGRRYVRFSFAGATADIAEAARRIVAWRRGPRR